MGKAKGKDKEKEKEKQKEKAKEKAKEKELAKEKAKEKEKEKARAKAEAKAKAKAKGKKEGVSHNKDVSISSSRSDESSSSSSHSNDSDASLEDYAEDKEPQTVEIMNAQLLAKVGAAEVPKIVKITTKQTMVQNAEGVSHNKEEKTEDLTPGGTGAITVVSSINKAELPEDAITSNVPHVKATQVTTRTALTKEDKESPKKSERPPSSPVPSRLPRAVLVSSVPNLMILVLPLTSIRRNRRL